MLAQVTSCLPEVRRDEEGLILINIIFIPGGDVEAASFSSPGQTLFKKPFFLIMQNFWPRSHRGRRNVEAHAVIF